MITIKDLYKTYNTPAGEVHALKDINLSIPKGEIHGIIGLSGAGKSTLVRCLNRLETPTSGDVYIDGTNLLTLSNSELRETRKKIGMIFQHFNLFNNKTIYDNIAFPLRLNKVAESEIKERVEYLLELVELSDKAKAYPSQLSGGQKQRVGIARALANDPYILLCDEATSALDPKTTDQILKLLKDINKKLNLTMIVITHEMEVIKAISDSVTVLEHGGVVESNDVISIFSNPKSNYTKSLIFQGYELSNKFKGKNLLSLNFGQDVSLDPVICDLIKETDVELNILCGNIDLIKDSPIGHLLVEISNADDVPKVLSYLNKRNINCEVIKHG